VPDRIPRPADAIAFLKRKKIVPTEAWNDLQWGEHSHAFTVAHSMNAAVLEDLLGALTDAMERGTTYEAFKADMKPLMEAKGWYGGRPDKEGDEGYLEWRLRTIYDTNLSTAYTAGRYRQQLRSSGLRPILVYSAVMDDVTRPEHRALNGKAYRSDNPFWDRYYPPNGWKCRCSTYSLSESEAESRGVEVLTEIPAGIDPERIAPPEWRYNPGKEAFAPDFSKYGYLKKAVADDGKSMLSQVKEAYAASMRETRLTQAEWKVWSDRVLEEDYKVQKIPVLGGTAPTETSGEIDSKLMITDKAIRHGQREGKHKMLPREEIGEVYAAINDPDAIYQERGSENEYSFVRAYDETYVTKAFFRRATPTTSLGLVSYELVKGTEYSDDTGKKYREVYKK
jgi:SPP1 gp7 family putative phage head morphogenesis protein